MLTTTPDERPATSTSVRGAAQGGCFPAGTLSQLSLQRPLSRAPARGLPARPAQSLIRKLLPRAAGRLAPGRPRTPAPLLAWRSRCRRVRGGPDARRLRRREGAMASLNLISGHGRPGHRRSRTSGSGPRRPVSPRRITAPRRSPVSRMQMAVAGVSLTATAAGGPTRIHRASPPRRRGPDRCRRDHLRPRSARRGQMPAQHHPRREPHHSQAGHCRVRRTRLSRLLPPSRLQRHREPRRCRRGPRGRRTPTATSRGLRRRPGQERPS